MTRIFKGPGGRAGPALRSSWVWGGGVGLALTPFLSCLPAHGEGELGFHIPESSRNHHGFLLLLRSDVYLNH